MNSLGGYDALIEVRATRLVRLHLACCRPVSRARVRLKRQRDAAMAALVAAVEARDRAIAAQVARARSPRPRRR